MSERWSDILTKNPEIFENNSVIGLFRLAVQKQPDHPALVTETAELTYRELEQKSNQVACALRKRGIQAGEIVAVHTGRAAESIIAFLAIWKIGCAYLFVDPGCPGHRTEDCLEDCQVRLTITREFIEQAFAEQPDVCVPEVGDRERLAVIVYTSGSSGKPKGVRLLQRNIAASVSNFPEIGFSGDDRYACFASLMFVASVYDISMSLSIGATLYLVPEEIRRDIRALADYYRKNGITVTFLPPHMAMKYIGIDEGSPLRILISGSESVRNLKKRSYEIVNVYASSEACAIISHYTIQDSRKDYPIGKVVGGLKYWIVDTDENLAAHGEMGELWISGPQVCQGYLNTPELTKKRFLANPFTQEKPYEFVFRTGDMVREDEDGNLVYCGRADNMVKVRGFRIELTGVERRMLHFPGMKEVCCVAHKDSGGTNLLFGYYISETEINHEALRSYLAEYLPAYMIPIGLIRCSEFPRTWSGKVDRKRFEPPKELDDHKKVAVLYR
ncbi:MAG: amino acid adenylation domain-containing protein [Brotaphodocola sp.]